MIAPVIVLTSESIRGVILKKVLAQNGFKALWFKNYYDAEAALDKQTPLAVVFDAKGLHSRETGPFVRLRERLPDTGIIVLAETWAIPTFQAAGCSSDLCLPEPIDPELIVSRIKEILSSRSMEISPDGNPGKEIEKDTGKEEDRVIDYLKEFLRLD